MVCTFLLKLVLVIIAHGIMVDFAVVFVKSFVSDFILTCEAMSFGSWTACDCVKVVIDFAYFIVAFTGSFAIFNFNSSAICEVSMIDQVASSFKKRCSLSNECVEQLFCVCSF